MAGTVLPTAFADSTGQLRTPKEAAQTARSIRSIVSRSVTRVRASNFHIDIIIG